jgi:hypothetical protein
MEPWLHNKNHRGRIGFIKSGIYSTHVKCQTPTRCRTLTSTKTVASLLWKWYFDTTIVFLLKLFSLSSFGPPKKMAGKQAQDGETL